VESVLESYFFEGRESVAEQSFMIDRRTDLAEKLASKPGNKSAARPSGAERRTAQRFALVATAEIADITSGTRLTGRVSDLSLSGCYMDVMTPFAEKSRVQLRIKYNAQTVEVTGVVRFSHSGLGMGIGFESLLPPQMEMLGSWISMLTNGHVAPIDLPKFEEAPAVAAPRSGGSTDRKALENLTVLLVRKGVLTPAEVTAMFSKEES
jgi:PilZ domain